MVVYFGCGRGIWTPDLRVMSYDVVSFCIIVCFLPATSFLLSFYYSKYFSFLYSECLSLWVTHTKLSLVCICLSLYYSEYFHETFFSLYSFVFSLSASFIFLFDCLFSSGDLFWCLHPKIWVLVWFLAFALWFNPVCVAKNHD